MTTDPLPHEVELVEATHTVAFLANLVTELSGASPEAREEVRQLLNLQLSDYGHASESRHLRPMGRARKVSVSMPEDLTAAVQQRVGRGEFSQYVTEAVARQFEVDLLQELALILEAEHGPVSDEALAEARHAWPDA